MQLNGYQKIVLKKEERPAYCGDYGLPLLAFPSIFLLCVAATSCSCLPYSYSPSYHEFLPANLLMLLLCSSFLRVCYCTHGRLHFCGYMRGSSQLSSGSSQLSSARALLCMSTLNGEVELLPLPGRKGQLVRIRVGRKVLNRRSGVRRRGNL